MENRAGDPEAGRLASSELSEGFLHCQVPSWKEGASRGPSKLGKSWPDGRQGMDGMNWRKSTPSLPLTPLPCCLCWQRGCFPHAPCYLWECHWSLLFLQIFHAAPVRRISSPEHLQISPGDFWQHSISAFLGIHYLTINQPKEKVGSWTESTIGNKMLCVAVVDSPAFPEETTEFWDVTTGRAIRSLQLWIEPERWCVLPQTPWLCWDSFTQA